MKLLLDATLENDERRIHTMPKNRFKYDTQVRDGGRVEFNVPLDPGVRVTVFVIESPNSSFDDLLSATESSLDFWDNPVDDEDWNNA